MSDILIAFVIPIITIILSIILETILRCPYKVTGIAFVGLMIAAFALGGTLIYIAFAWLYTILALGVAVITERILRNNCNCSSSCSTTSSCSSSSSCSGCSRCSSSRSCSRNYNRS